MPKSPYVYDPTEEKGPGLYRRLMNRLNPFYFGSAALILYGICLVLRDDRLLDDHTSKLLFNFSALQLYELCLILVALFLIKRRIINDSLMLVIIEQVLLLIPFMLHHGNFDTPTAMAVDLVLLPLAAIALFARWFMLTKRYPGINLPRRLCGLGLPILIVNISLPLIYWWGFNRELPDFKDHMYFALEVLCYAVLPTLFAFPLLLSRKRQWAVESPGQPWLPVISLLVWAGMTLFHLSWIPYVYDLHWEYVLFLPGIWMMAWVLNSRFRDLTKHERPWGRAIMVAVPAVTAVLLFFPSLRTVCRWLTILNVLIYIYCVIRRHYPRLTGWLALGSLVSIIATLPSTPAVPGVPGTTAPVDAAPPALTITIFLVLVFLICLPLRKSYATTAASLSLALLVIRFTGGVDLVHGRGIAVGLAFFLVHSLRWSERNSWVTAVRTAAASGWLLYAMAISVYLDAWEPVLMNGGCAVIPFVCYAFIYVFESRRDELLILIPCLGILLLTPIRIVVSIYRNCGPGPAAVLAAFAMLSIGTFEAVRRSQHEKTGVQSC